MGKIEIDTDKYYTLRKDARLHAFLPEYCKCKAHRDSGWLLSFKHKGLIILLCHSCGWEERYKEIMKVDGEQ